MTYNDRNRHGRKGTGRFPRMLDYTTTRFYQAGKFAAGHLACPLTLAPQA
jgi:hypothetical protein